VLDAVAVLLSRFAGRLRSLRSNGRLVSQEDIRLGTKATKIKLTIEYQNATHSWWVTKHLSRRKGQKISNLGELNALLEKLHEGLDSVEPFNLPLMVHYPVHRAVMDIPLRIRKRHAFDQLSAYDQALTGATSNFRVFFEWYRNREDLENEMRIEKSKTRDRQLKAVRSALSQVMPGYSKLRVRRSPLRMTLQKGSAEIWVDHLSDGEKCMLALVGDLARRLSIANPGMANPLTGEGIVLIDEVDLHLHPAWQRMLIPAMEATFPNLQFLLTTHSPAVLGHVRDKSIIVMEATASGNAAIRSLAAYGKDANRVLEDILGTTSRPKEIQDWLNRIHTLITDGQTEDAATELEKLRGVIQEDPSLTRAEALINRRRVLGR